MSPSKKANPTNKGSKAGRAKGSQVVKNAGGRKKKEEVTPVTQPVNLPASKPENKTFTVISRVLAVLAVIGITIFVYSIRDRVEAFAQYGYFGAFLIMLIANATVILPAPGVAVVFAMGGVLNPLGVALAAGVGGTLGELVEGEDVLMSIPERDPMKLNAPAVKIIRVTIEES